MTLSAQSTPARQSFSLAKALWLDAITACGFAVVCLSLSAYLARLTGLSVTLIDAAGAVSLLAAGIIAFAAARTPPPKALVRTIIVGNAIWVLASLLVAAVAGLSAIGLVLVLGQAACVALLTGLEHTLSSS